MKLSAEERIVASIIVNNERYGELRGLCCKEKGPYHIVDAMCDLHIAEEPINLISVVDRLKLRNHLDFIGGIKYVTDIVDASLTTLFYPIKKGQYEQGYRMIKELKRGMSEIYR